MTMKSLLFAVLAFSSLLACSGVKTGTPVRDTLAAERRSLLTIPTLDDVKATCKTTAKATLSLDSVGKASVKAASSCKAFAKSVNAVESIVKEFLQQVQHTPKQGCTTVRVQEIIRRCAQAITKVFTKAAVSIEIQGDAVACADATSEGDAYAKAFSALLVNLWLGVSSGGNSAESEAQVSTLTYTLSTAWAEAKTKKCLVGTGSVKDFDASLAEQVRVALTCVVVEVAVKLCDKAFIGEEAKAVKGSSKECKGCGSKNGGNEALRLSIFRGGVV